MAAVHDDVTTTSKNISDDVPGSEYPCVQHGIIGPPDQSGMSIVKHDDVCSLSRSKTSTHWVEGESSRTSGADRLEQAAAG